MIRFTFGEHEVVWDGNKTRMTIVGSLTDEDFGMLVDLLMGTLFKKEINDDRLTNGCNEQP